MKTESSVARIVGNAIRKYLGLSVLLVLVIVLSVGFALLPPLVLEKIVDTLTVGDNLLFSMAV